METPRDLYIGLMSGTSIDAIDAVLVDLSNGCQLLQQYSHPINAALREEIIALNNGCDDELNRSQRLCRQLGHLFADAVNALLTEANVSADAIHAIGSHGQTLRHAPDGPLGFTLQVGDPNTIAENTGITVVGDFRRKDVAAGGQGAPLVPAFHHFAFAETGHRRAIVNIGGMANVTLLNGMQTPHAGFDTGPGNVLLDAWYHKTHSQLFDADGTWARTGKVIEPLLEALLKNDYFHMSAPKSCGRERFHLGWLTAFDVENYHAEDVQATLTELTAVTIAEAIDGQCEEIFLCGGGAFNGLLRERIAFHAEVPINNTQALGVPPQWLEAMAFAWFARQTLDAKPTNVPCATGAQGQRILGAIYPAG